MIDERIDKDRIKCPVCGAFLMELKPKMISGQVVVCQCWKCHNEVKIKKK